MCGVYCLGNIFRLIAFTGASMSTYLITGAAGSLGSLLVSALMEGNNIVRAYDIDEYGLAALPKGSGWPEGNVRKIHGSITDVRKLSRAIRGVDVVVHCAAMKNLDISEYNVQSLLDTNVRGTYNVATVCQDHEVKTAVYISSDKAATATTTYGVTKLLGERIWKWAARTSKTPFLTLRSGNFFTSRGNVFEVWEKQHKHGDPLTLTNPAMQRYFIETEVVAQMVIDIINNAGVDPLRSGSVVVPKMREELIFDLMKTCYPTDEYRVIGPREGESLREDLFCKSDTIFYEDERWTVVG